MAVRLSTEYYQDLRGGESRIESGWLARSSRCWSCGPDLCGLALARAAVGPEKGRKILGRHGPPEEVALGPITVPLAENVKLLLALHPFGYHLEPQRARDRHHRGRDGGIGGVGVDVAHEGLVDLQRVDGECLEIAERRVTGTEVVDGDPHPQSLELAQYLDGVLGVLHGQALGDLQLQKPRIELGFPEGLVDVAHEVRILELPGGEVDRDRQRASEAGLPDLDLKAGGPEDPGGEPRDDTGQLSPLHERARGEQPALRVLPSQQRLAAVDGSRGHVEERLVIENELVPRNGPSQGVVQGQAFRGR